MSGPSNAGATRKAAQHQRSGSENHIVKTAGVDDISGRKFVNNIPVDIFN